MQDLVWAMKNAILSIVTALVWLISSNVQAQQIDEVRFGGTWAQPSWLEKDHPEDEQFGVGAELFFSPVNIDFLALFEGQSNFFLDGLLNPRPHVGVMANFADDGTSYAYTGLTWQYELGSTFFLETGFGFGVHNGEKESITRERARLGSQVLFHESLGLGANISEDMTLVLAVEHLSHASLFDSNNRGLSNVSLRLGKKF